MRFRPGVSGNPAGKPRGARDRYPRSAKRAMELMLEAYARQKLPMVMAAMDKGIQARPPHSAGYLKLAIDHVKGLPDQTLDLAAKIVLSPRD